MQPLPSSEPSITTYGNFLYGVASLMPALQDRISQAPTLMAKYDQVLHFDKVMRDLVLSQLPSCLNSVTAIEPSWPCWLPVARRCLTITSAHKIIMIHRKFLGMSFHDKRFAFTRRTCLAAAKTIIHEVKSEILNDTPIFWTLQAFSVAAAIILSLDNFNRQQSAREYAEHRQLVTQTIDILSESASVSLIAARGARLLSELLVEEYKRGQNTDEGKRRDDNNNNSYSIGHDRNLNVAAFVRKFCESDQPPVGNSPIATTNIPLWLQDSGLHSHSLQHAANDHHVSGQSHNIYPNVHSLSAQQSYNVMTAPGYQVAPDSRRQYDTFANAFGHGESFDVRSLNWFDDLLGLAPSHSI